MVRIFEYSRGDTYKVQVTINDVAGSVVVTKSEVPANTPEEVKAKLMDEAEIAVLAAMKEPNLYG